MAETTPIAERPRTNVEAVLHDHRMAVVVLLVVVPLMSWAWIVVMARDMYGSMTGASAWMMTPVWDGPHLLLLWAMWAVMMAGMMLPSISPMLLTYGVVARRSAQRTAARQIYALAAGYLLVWAGFSAGATALQRVLAALLLVSPMMEVSSPKVGGAFLLMAGLYQLAPLKQSCLRRCQSPIVFLMSHWRAGTTGALRMGLDHGAYCVGCCWGLMLLLFAGGVMNLTVIAALTLFVAFEKLTSSGTRGTHISGVLLIAAGLWMTAS
jgi:predicted metal-binding membrane protein